MCSTSVCNHLYFASPTTAGRLSTHLSHRRSCTSPPPQIATQSRTSFFKMGENSPPAVDTSVLQTIGINAAAQRDIEVCNKPASRRSACCNVTCHTSLDSSVDLVAAPASDPPALSALMHLISCVTPASSRPDLAVDCSSRRVCPRHGVWDSTQTNSMTALPGGRSGASEGHAGAGARVSLAGHPGAAARCARCHVSCKSQV